MNRHFTVVPTGYPGRQRTNLNVVGRPPGRGVKKCCRALWKIAKVQRPGVRLPYGMVPGRHACRTGAGRMQHHEEEEGERCVHALRYSRRRLRILPVSYENFSTVTTP